MDALLAAHAHQERTSNLSRSLAETDNLIALLQNARAAAAANPSTATLQAAKLKRPVEQAFERLDGSLKEVNKGLNGYQKALKEKFKTAAVVPTSANEGLVRRTDLINRAIAMHLLREGKFDVANTFVWEVNLPQLDAEIINAEPRNTTGNTWAEQQWVTDETMGDDDDDSSGIEERRSREHRNLRRKFAEMYHILDALRNQHDLQPAIAWAREHSAELETRGSNLEFDLARLKFMQLYVSDQQVDNSEDAGGGSTPPGGAQQQYGHLSGPLRALLYARETFPALSARYARETASLLGSLAFSPQLSTSPYAGTFQQAGGSGGSPSDDGGCFDDGADGGAAYADARAAVTREFCGLLGLAAHSPLYTALTAGGLALPRLEKFERVMAQHRGTWTSVNELPVETPLPPGFQFHSVFVCPVSKEQATDANPPMMLPCGHVIAKESLEAHSKHKPRMKCPYCPVECTAKEARRIYI